MKNKFIIFLVSLLLISMLMSSCGFISINSPETTSVEETTEAETTYNDPDLYVSDYETVINKYLRDLSGNEYEGSVKIAIAGTNIITGEDNTSEVLTKDWAERNEAVENNLGASIATEKYTADKMLTEIKAATYAGTYFADIIMIPQKHIGSFMQSNAIVNLTSLPGFDYNTDYIYSDSVSAGTGGGSIYAISGAASVNNDDLSCIYFNKNIIAELTTDDIYQVVKDGKWTVDYYMNLVQSIDSNKYYSYTSQNMSQSLADLFFFGMGGKMTESKLNKYPELILGNSENSARVYKAKDALNDNKSYTNSLEGIDKFLKGNTAFYIDKLSYKRSIVHSSFDWGILPMPKYDEAQENYYSLVDYTSSLFFAVPPTATNYEESADYISALNIISYGYNNDKYIEYASYYYLRDQESIDTLALVVANPVFDFGYSFASTSYTSISNGTFSAVRNTVDGISSLERYIDMYDYLFDNAVYYLFDK